MAQLGYAASVLPYEIGLAPDKDGVSAAACANLGSTRMRIAIIGAGRLGTALGRRLVEGRHEVMFGGGSTAADAARTIAASAASNREATAWADLVVLAVPFDAVEEALATAGPLDGKVLWSCVNALRPDFTGLVVGFDTSAAEQVALRAVDARVVAAVPPFAEALAARDLRYEAGLVPSVFVCGDDGDAKSVVGELAREIGAEPVDAGPLRAARLVEPAMMLLVSIAYGGLPRDVALRLLERTAVGAHGEESHA
jgi:8-hydroxy-5-deazaflavin:NADPH oxidoreductase